MKVLVLLLAVALATALPPQKHAPSSNSGVINGDDATKGEFPHIISLQVFSRGEYHHSCGGSILNRNWIITAAHCVESGATQRVVAGEHNLVIDDGTEQKIDVAQRIIHEDYQFPNNDIAMIRLAEPLTFNEYVQPIGMLEYKKEYVGDGIIAGWGLTESGDIPDILQRQSAPIVSNGVCDAEMWLYNIQDHMVCSGNPAGGIGVCNGDSGGPLMDDSDGQRTLIGLTSWGTFKGCAAEGTYGVFTKVSYFVDWVYQTMGLYSM